MAKPCGVCGKEYDDEHVQLLRCPQFRGSVQTPNVLVETYGALVEACSLAWVHMYGRGQWDKDRETWNAVERALKLAGVNTQDLLKAMNR